MALNDTSNLTIPVEDAADPRSPRALRAATLAGVPELSGTEAEIAAALPVRERLLLAADDYLTALRGAEILTEEQTDTAVSVPRPVSAAEVLTAQQALNRLRHQTAAAWWTAHEETKIEEALREV